MLLVYTFLEFCQLLYPKRENNGLNKTQISILPKKQKPANFFTILLADYYKRLLKQKYPVFF